MFLLETLNSSEWKDSPFILYYHYEEQNKFIVTDNKRIFGKILFQENINTLVKNNKLE